MENTAKTSLYDYISAAVTDGELPMDFSLPRFSDDNNQVPWADGAKDGVAMYHIGYSKLSRRRGTLIMLMKCSACSGKMSVLFPLLMRFKVILLTTRTNCRPEISMDTECMQFWIPQTENV